MGTGIYHWVVKDSACCPRWQMRVEEVAEGESQQSGDMGGGGW